MVDELDGINAPSHLQRHQMGPCTFVGTFPNEECGEGQEEEGYAASAYLRGFLPVDLAMTH
jgi:hypothetical protein